MILTVNGIDRTVDRHATVVTLLGELSLGAQQRGVAVAINAEVIPRSAWVSTSFEPGDRVEVLVAVQGG